jgi:hypothetical protein
VDHLTLLEAAQALGAFVQAGIIGLRTLAGYAVPLGLVAAAAVGVGRALAIQDQLRRFNIGLGTPGRGAVLAPTAGAR